MEEKALGDDVRPGPNPYQQYPRPSSGKPTGLTTPPNSGPSPHASPSVTPTPMIPPAGMHPQSMQQSSGPHHPPQMHQQLGMHPHYPSYPGSYNPNMGMAPGEGLPSQRPEQEYMDQSAEREFLQGLEDGSRSSNDSQESGKGKKKARGKGAGKGKGKKNQESEDGQVDEKPAKKRQSKAASNPNSPKLTAKQKKALAKQAAEEAAANEDSLSHSPFPQGGGPVMQQQQPPHPMQQHGHDPHSMGPQQAPFPHHQGLAPAMSGHQPYLQPQQHGGHQVNPHSMAPPQQSAHHSGMSQGMPMHSMSGHSQTHYPPPSQSGHPSDGLHAPRVLLHSNALSLHETFFL